MMAKIVHDRHPADHAAHLLAAPHALEGNQRGTDEIVRDAEMAGHGDGGGGVADIEDARHRDLKIRSPELEGRAFPVERHICDPRRAVLPAAEEADGGEGGRDHIAHVRFLPEALINYLARLGWSHGDDELFSVEQLVEWFDLDHINNLLRNSIWRSCAG